MNGRDFRKGLLFFTILGGLVTLPSLIWAGEAVQSWEFIHPEGVVIVEPLTMNPHPPTLEGKTVLLRWNGKHNGDTFLNRVADLLVERVKNVKVIKAYVTAPRTVGQSRSLSKSKEWAQMLAKLKPDIVIASQAD